MKELVTILIPTYNGQKYIKQMLDSIYMQDYRPMEVIISDDASQDGTITEVSRWIKNRNMVDISFKIIRNSINKGLSGNISRAAKYIHGKYLFFSDQDDIWESFKVSAQVEYLEKNEDCIMCICDRSIIDEKNKIVCHSLFQYKHADIRKRDYKKVLNSPILYSANCMCLRTDHLNSIFPIPARICEHDTFITIMAAHFGNIGYIKSALTQYRIHGNNLSKQYALETNRNLLKAGYIVFKNFERRNARESNDPPILEKELKRRFNEVMPKWLQYIYPGKIDNLYMETIKYIFHNLNRWKRFC